MCCQNDSTRKPERIHTMEYFFLFVVVKLIVVWVLLERDAF